MSKKSSADKQIGRDHSFETMQKLTFQTEKQKGSSFNKYMKFTE